MDAEHRKTWDLLLDDIRSDKLNHISVASCKRRAALMAIDHELLRLEEKDEKSGFCHCEDDTDRVKLMRLESRIKKMAEVLRHYALTLGHADPKRAVIEELTKALRED